MDPLSVTASIIAVVGAGTTTVKLLKKLVSLKNAPAIALALDSELSDLRLNVLAIQDLFMRQAEKLTSHSGGDTVLDRDVIANIARCLKQTNDLAVDLDHLLNPLLSSTFHSGNAMPGKWYGWIKNEKKLKRFQQELHDTRIKLNTLFGMLSL
ncbi:MAG: hypothetical protein Q9187_004373 [Circinaria calcarea]